MALPATSAWAWHDPMRPQGDGALSLQSAPETPLTLTSILMAEQRRVAIVNGRVVTVGDEINGYRVVSITARQVELQKGTKHHRLQLATTQQAPSVKRKITE
nr:hypothetical protein [uncultured Desulfuromonas sp.]